MFGRKKEDNPKKPRRSGGSLAQYGLIDIPDFDNFDKMGADGGDDEDDDDALEAELLALTSGAPVPKKEKKVPAPVAPAQLDRMVAASLRDIPSDESVSGDDDDDPALLEELTGLVSDEERDESGKHAQPQEPQNEVPTTPKLGLETLLNERLSMYQQAEVNAKTAGESARARRLGRGIKTLSDLLKQVKTGKPIDENEIPPPVAIQITRPATTTEPEQDAQAPPPVPPRSAPPVPQRAAPLPPSPGAVPLPGLIAVPDTDTKSEEPSSPEKHVVIAPEPSANEDNAVSERQGLVALLTNRRDEYKLAAVKAKRIGDIETAKRFVKIAKQFDTVISAVEEGKPVDLSAMPPPPPSLDEAPSKINNPSIPDSTFNEKKEEQEKQRSSEPAPSSDDSQQPTQEEASVSEEDVYQVTANSVMEALEQRLKVYQDQEESAREAGNSSKARRMGRIVKQYQDAIKLHKLGRPIPVDELPTPPGYAPIPVEGKLPPSSGGGNVPGTSTKLPTQQPEAAAAPSSPNIPSKPKPVVSPSTTNPVNDNNNISDPVSDKETQKVNARRGAVERQMSFLTSRQKEFRLAALEAKRKGEMNQAKEFLRLAKGFEPLLDAASSGLPIDMESVPLPPSAKKALEADFDIVTKDECTPNSNSEIFDKLESDLSSQLKMCMHTRNHFKAIGDVASANRFEQLALNSKKDLDFVRIAHKRNDCVPRFHYEMKSFSIVQCNTDLTDNDLELTFIQGINYNVPNPKEVDTYIKYVYPYPNEEPVKDKTAVVYNTNNPEYNVTIPLTIHRNSRACQRVFKRHSIKCEIWSKGGFLRGDTLIGTASVKLQPLETKCTLHDSFDLMDGRKTVGGKLEVKIRIRNPILTKQVEQVQEKWLVIDH